MLIGGGSISAISDLDGCGRMDGNKLCDFPMLRRLSLGVAAAALLLLLQPRTAHASPFSSNVVALTARNWKREVEDSPHGVFVNICRSG